ncbi:ileal sodium/bile acid cotransporter-like [Tubulanus polymorphus]|uniref:ileal sodium/bile acid cotransporter-like n=1 Tax=Tubulanus polymorphus TaxID=672921 RepID=UPI003DA2CBF7
MRVVPTSIMRMLYCLFTLLCISRFSMCIESSENATSYSDGRLSLKVEPPELNNLSMWNGIAVITINYQLNSENPWKLKTIPEDDELVTIAGSGQFLLNGTNDLSGTKFSGSINLTLSGHFIGFTNLKFYISNDSKVLSDSNSTWYSLPVEYLVTVIRPDRVVDIIFRVTISILVVISMILMGTKVDLDVVKEVLKRPYSPAIGFFCQVLIMPSLAYGISRMLRLNPSQALGIFATGCAPGGGLSNTYTYLLDGDLSLSITMTVISTIASLGTIPLWMFTVGRLIIEDIPNKQMKIPYKNIFITLVMIVIPVGIGLLLQKKAPKWTKMLSKCMRPFLIVLILFIASFGIWVNVHMFKLFTPKVVGAGMLLPWTGFALGALIPFIFRRPITRVFTIAIEIGIQNTGVPILLLLLSLEAPLGDLAIIGPVAVASFTPFPLLIAIAFVEIRKRWCNRGERQLAVDDDKGEYMNGDATREDADFVNIQLTNGVTD